ncbi:hypothetical protein MD484_g8446, partial [Candolleomyces efflorescens]
MKPKTTCETIEDDANENVNPLPNDSTILLDLACNLEAHPVSVERDDSDLTTVPTTIDDNLDAVTVNEDEPTIDTATYSLGAMTDPSTRRELPGSARLLWRLRSDESATRRLSMITTWAHT